MTPEERQALWRMVAMRTCMDCFHPECNAISDAAIALFNLIEAADERSGE